MVYIVCINKSDQWCFFLNVDGIDHILHIMTKNFPMDVTAANSLEAMKQITDPSSPAEDHDNHQLCSLPQNMETNVNTPSRTAEATAKLCCHGIQVDDDNKPAPESMW